MSLPLLSILIALPLVAGALLMLFGEDRNPALARGTALAVSLLNAVLALPLFAGGAWAEKAPWIPAFGIDYALRVDGLSVYLVLLAALLTPAAIAASWKIVPEKARLYFGSILILSGGMIGVAAASDLFLFYVFWEIMLIPAYFLVGVFGGPKAAAATTKFVIYTMAGSLFMLVAIIYTGYAHFAATGAWSFSLDALYALDFAPTAGRWAFAAFALAFAIKAALFPLHTWLPDTYGEAPAPVTFLLSAVMAKLGVYGFLRLAIPLFPEAARFFAPVLITCAVVGVIYAALVALAQDDAKRTIAYASVSHLGVILLGVFTLSPQALSGAVFHLVGHALTTGAMFLLIGFIAERKGTTSIKALGGLTASVPMLAVAMLFVTLASVGLPGLGGFPGEFLIFLGAYGAHPLATSIAVFSVVLGASYMLSMFQRTMFGPVSPENRALPDIGAREIAILVPVVAGVTLLGVFPQPLLSRINPAVEHYLQVVGAPNAPVNHVVLPDTEAAAPGHGGAHE